MIIKRKFKLWPKIPSISTIRTITQNNTIFKRFCNNLHFEIRGIKKTKVTSQGSQAWLWSSMPEIFAFGILEEFEDTKGVVTIHKSKQDRHQLTK